MTLGREGGGGGAALNRIVGSKEALTVPLRGKTKNSIGSTPTVVQHLMPTLVYASILYVNSAFELTGNGITAISSSISQKRH
jgi:hypothetical protein